MIKDLFFTQILIVKKEMNLKENQKASMCFHWKSLRRQVRAIGKVEEVSAKEADDYFNSRPYKNRIGAWASSQSKILDKRETFLKKLKNLKKNILIKIMFQDLLIGLDGDYYQMKLNFG